MYQQPNSVVDCEVCSGRFEKDGVDGIQLWRQTNENTGAQVWGCVLMLVRVGGGGGGEEGCEGFLALVANKVYRISISAYKSARKQQPQRNSHRHHQVLLSLFFSTS